MLVDPRRGGDTGAPCGWRKRAGRGGRPGRLVAPREGERPGLRRPGSRRGEAAPTGCWSTRDRGTAGVLVERPPRDRGDRGDSWSTGSTRREGGKEAQGRARALRPRGPLWEGGSARPPPATSKRLSGRGPPALPPFPVPARGERPGGEGGGQRAGRPDAPGAERRGERTPPHPSPRREAGPGEEGWSDGRGWDGMGRLRRAPNPPALPRPAPLRSAPPGPRLPPRQGRRDAGGTEEEDRTGQDRTGPDKPLCRGLTFNRSQRGSCSATYETPTQKQVVYEWFSTRFPTNVRCVTGEGAAPFPAAPRFPGRGALRTGPRSRRAAGHAAPRGARAAARRRGRRGTGYPRPTEAPRRCRIVPPGRDSDLEAFSHNPTDGSFAPLAPQPSTYTKCLNLRFLSY